MPDFVHLHNHTDYSLLDGAAPIDKMVEKAVSFGMKHLAITDHGNMFGVLRFYKACKAHEINPLIGCEVYVAPGSRHVKNGSEKGNRYQHLVLLARNSEGYKNLIQLCSRGYTEGFYYKPRIDDELLEQYNGGLTALSACLAGAIPSMIMNGKAEEAEQKANYYRELFGKEHFFLEMQDHGIPEQKTVNKELVRISKKTGIPLVATNDIHYLDRADASAQDILLCIGTNRKRREQDRMRFHSDQFYMKSQEEMAETFREIPEALSNTLRVAEQCNLEIDLPGPILPEYEIPPEFENLGDYLRHLTFEGLKKRYPSLTDEIVQRAEKELGIINSMHFPGYFLIVWDFIHYAKQHDIPVGPGRGSGAGSIVAYALTITDIDPLKYQLLFERFLNPERVSMPDFDVDFCFERRQEVIDYVNRKYGKDKVGQIITFGTLKAKAVVKDVARVLDIPFAEADKISKLIPNDLKITIDKALEQEPQLKELMDQGGVYGELIDAARRLEGLSRHASTHAAGVVIGRKALTEYVPLYRDSKTGSISTQFTMDQLEECGLVKMDFLGLKTLTLIKHTEDLIHRRDKDFDIERVPEDDPATFTLLGEGKSTCVFQFESSGMQNILKQAHPTSIEDLIALNALYRPGPMQYIPQYIASKSGEQEIRYPDPSLEEVLKPTYGVIVYQEQVMQVAQIIGGFSLGKADILRRAMGKKKVKEMAKMKLEFIEGAVKKGHTKEHADEIFEMLVPFAGYGFNKSHAAAYSVVAYKTAYLKANYPAEFMAANLTNEINNPDKLAFYIGEAKTMGIDLLPPEVNISEKNFSVSDGKIVYGLIGIKNVGTNAVEEIVRAREEGGPFEDIFDLLDRVDMKTVNRKVLETLIECGALDSFGINRSTLLENLERVMEVVSKKKEGEQFGQSSLFDDGNEEEMPWKTDLTPAEPLPKMEVLRRERELLGFYFSGHPMDDFKDRWKSAVNIDLSRPDRFIPERTYTLIAMVTSLRTIITKKGRPMAFLQLEDYNGKIESVVFSKLWEQIRDKVETDGVIACTGKMDLSRGEPKLLLESFSDPSEIEVKGGYEVHIRIDRSLCTEEKLLGFRSFLVDFQGACPVYFHIVKKNGQGETIIQVNRQISLSSEDDALDQIRSHPHIEDVWTA
ncbi:DNA polymerase III subunit alpha [Sediminispirochaeta smaragdinae]|jgi:DNA polymerase-3 subunit alpha|uniref:DNA polymerase III subunit alpha n=1 Tax=Sediminispirochaeta smaragdinae (strain DSM 11293 / JCM 15392 / SEBR 4228) TaxID=573413 RepID=E1R432_SEDSS|nr:DNA polymerase III subunit alpha [Sediminispirochaeta smaragdinae]ADK80454.1 DNA polymerase III, alpha subunit [Sediminispirochaeta smaragdinae DSM 11293]